MRGAPTIRLALLHYADVENYGDVLFPTLAAGELRRRLANVEIDFFSPTGRGPDPSHRYDPDRLASYDAVVLAGGELVHRYDRMLRGIYERLGVSAIDRPTDLVFGWSEVRGPYKAWLGVGVPALDAAGREVIARRAPQLDTLVVRGTGSARRLREAGAGATVSVDIGWMFSRLVIDPTPASPPMVVLHALPGAAPDSLATIVEPLRALAGEGYEVVLLPLCRCWGDQDVLGQIAARSGFRLVDHRIDERAKLDLLASCAMYIGQSMHGFISALAAGRPAGLVFPRADDKFSELLADSHLDDLRVERWDELPALIGRLRALSLERIRDVHARHLARADAVFDDLAAAIARHVARRLRVSPDAPSWTARLLRP